VYKGGAFKTGMSVSEDVWLTKDAKLLLSSLGMQLAQAICSGQALKSLTPQLTSQNNTKAGASERSHRDANSECDLAN
jgi:hypothetical protein